MNISFIFLGFSIFYQFGLSKNFHKFFVTFFDRLTENSLVYRPVANKITCSNRTLRSQKVFFHKFFMSIVTCADVEKIGVKI